MCAQRSGRLCWLRLVQVSVWHVYAEISMLLDIVLTHTKSTQMQTHAHTHTHTHAATRHLLLLLLYEKENSWLFFLYMRMCYNIIWKNNNNYKITVIVFTHLLTAKVFYFIFGSIFSKLACNASLSKRIPRIHFEEFSRHDRRRWTKGINNNNNYN